MSGIFEAGVLSTATAATADLGAAVLWNTGTPRIRLLRIELTSTSATASKVAIKRISARGTNSATLAGTPIDSNDTGVTGTIDTAWSAGFTVTGSYIRRAHIAPAIGVGLIWSWESEDVGLQIAGGAGIGLVTPTALALQAMELTFVWRE